MCGKVIGWEVDVEQKELSTSKTARRTDLNRNIIEERLRIIEELRQATRETRSAAEDLRAAADEAKGVLEEAKQE
jgi:hypothetical protein